MSALESRVKKSSSCPDISRICIFTMGQIRVPQSVAGESKLSVPPGGRRLYRLPAWPRCITSKVVRYMMRVSYDARCCPSLAIASLYRKSASTAAAWQILLPVGPMPQPLLLLVPN